MGEELQEELGEIISNSKLSELYLALARDLDVMEPKLPEEVPESSPSLATACWPGAFHPVLLMLSPRCRRGLAPAARGAQSRSMGGLQGPALPSSSVSLQGSTHALLLRCSTGPEAAAHVWDMPERDPAPILSDFL